MLKGKDSEIALAAVYTYNKKKTAQLQLKRFKTEKFIQGNRFSCARNWKVCGAIQKPTIGERVTKLTPTKHQKHDF